MKQVLTLGFDEVPDYKGMIAALTNCFNRALQAYLPQCPPSVAVDMNQTSQLAAHEFEWKRSLASKLKSNLH